MTPPNVFDPVSNASALEVKEGISFGSRLLVLIRAELQLGATNSSAQLSVLFQACVGIKERKTDAEGSC